jgi:hypothetical protein
LLLVLALLSIGLSHRNLHDYFLGDDFDLIHSFHAEPASYFVALLWSNESGEAWKSWGIDPALGRGYLRPLKIWLLALDLAVWGTNPLGFHLTSTAFFVANVLLVFAILRRAFPARPLLAGAGAAALALHPAFAEVVPFITAREELVANALGLGSFLAFLRARQDGRPLTPSALLYALALLTKESSVVFLALPLGWDLVNGRILPLSRSGARTLARTYLPVIAILGGYVALRYVAFGNPKGGDGEPTHYLSPGAYLGFHRTFWRSLLDPTLLSLGTLPGRHLLGVALGLLATVALGMRWRRVPAQRRRDLVLYGPLWYLGSTAILHGTYFAVHHNLLPVIGLGLFATLLTDTLLVAGGARREPVGAALLLLAAGACFLPPSLATTSEYRAASRAVAEIRARIEARSAGLPDGSTLSLRGVPQEVLPPYYFGWGLLSALKRPFTPSDLANRCTVVDARNAELNRARVPTPERYDLVIEFDPDEWVSPEHRARQRQRELRRRTPGAPAPAAEPR